MKIREIFTAAAIAIRHLTVASNKQQYLGKGLFPSKKKMGLDLKWLKTHKGLPISLAPSNFDAEQIYRSRKGSAPAYSIDLVEYFPELQDIANQVLDYFEK